MRRSSGLRFSGNLQQRLDMEALSRGDRAFLAKESDERLQAGLAWARSVGNATAEAAVLNELEARKEMVSQ